MIAGIRARWIEIVAFALILALAAILRLGDLGVRGTWDADQGHDMLVLRGLVLDGRIPLLGPPTSIGDFHHGVLYYVLLAPAALVSRADPVAVMTWIALGGVAAVAVTGWLARSIAGPVAGLIAGLLLAVSASGVDESTFIWNPNLIALSSSIALAASWQAWTTRRSRWWLVAGLAAVVTMHCHVLGVILTPVVGALLVADWRRRRRSGDAGGAAAVGRAGLTWVVFALLSYVPLAIHELGSGGTELRAAVEFVTSGGSGSSVALPVRFLIVGLRVLGWPLAGLLTNAPVATMLAATLVIGLAAWSGWLAPRSANDQRTALRWLALGLVWTIFALTIGASSLAAVVIGLPNDHYHAFADPIVIVLVAAGLATLIRTGAGSRQALTAVPAIAVLILLVGWNLSIQPPRRALDGGWDAARQAAARVIDRVGNRPIAMLSLPRVKSDEAVRMPLTAAGAALVPAGHRSAADPPPVQVILCDQLFHEAIGGDCGGPAEDSALATTDSPTARLIDRFEAAPGRWISIYAP